MSVHLQGLLSLLQKGKNTSHGGYGYYYAGSRDITSEAAASNLMEIDCETAKKKTDEIKKEAEKCEQGQFTSKEIDELDEEFKRIEDKLDEKIYEKMRVQAFEYFAL